MLESLNRRSHRDCHLEKQHILSTLKQCEGNRTRTAETLDINIRTLRNKLNEYKEQGEPVD